MRALNSFAFLTQFTFGPHGFFDAARSRLIDFAKRTFFACLHGPFILQEAPSIPTSVSTWLGSRWLIVDMTTSS